MGTTKTALPPMQKPDVDSSKTDDTPRESAAPAGGTVRRSPRRDDAAKIQDGAPAGTPDRARAFAKMQQGVGNARIARMVDDPGKPSAEREEQLADVYGSASADREKHAAHATPNIQREEAAPESRNGGYKTPRVMTKLEVNAPGDSYEQEADRVADRVAGGGNAAAGGDRKPAPRATPVMRAADPATTEAAAADPGTEAAIGKMKGGGSPLAHSVRSTMEPQFGRDFSAVRVHTGGDATRVARSLNAKAFTTGNDIAFADGQYAPDTPSGKKLLAHELTHVAQQGAAPEAPDVQRWSLLGDDRTEREKIDDALRSEDAADVKAIKEVNLATEAEKIVLLWILADQGWVGPFDEYKMEEIWGSFGDQVPRVMSLHVELWNVCIDGGAELEKLPSVKTASARFMTDVQGLALDYLGKNREYVKEQMKAVGVDEAAPTAQQDASLREVQNMSAEVKVAQDQERALRRIKVGATIESPSYGDDMAMPEDQFFDPNSPPIWNLSGEAKDSDRDWLKVKAVWDPIAKFISTVANRYPAIYAAIEQSDTYAGGKDKVADIAGAKSPAEARQIIGSALKEVLANIDESEKKILDNDPDYRDMVPLHAQLLGGRVKGPSGTDWSETFNKWVAQNDLKDYEARQFWVRLGLKTLAAAAFVVVEFATAGTATFFIGAAVGLGATGYLAANSIDRYLALERLSKSNVKDDTALVDKATVAAAGRQAIDDAIQFLMMAATVGVKLATAPKAPPPESGMTGCFTAGTPVLTAQGPKPIETVAAGDSVIARDPISGALVEQPVRRTFEKRVPALLDLQIGDVPIVCSPEHPFWVEGSGWRKAGRLQSGDNLRTSADNRVTIDSINRREGSFTVYNIEVETAHNFFVSPDGVLVHNKAAQVTFKQRLEQEVIGTMSERPGGETAEAWELKSLDGPHKMANPEPGLGPNQVRYQAKFYDTFNQEHVDISVNYDPDSGNFGIIKFASGK